jgi:WD40 repeat protein
LLAACGLTLSWTSSGAAQEPAKKTAAPSAAMQTKAETQIKSTFKTEYGEAQDDPAVARKLAITLLLLARKEKEDPVVRFVLLREARDLAAKADNVSTAFQAIADLARHYDISASTMRADAVVTAAPRMKTLQAQKALIPVLVRLFHDSLLDDDFKSAQRLLSATETMAKTLKDAQLLDQLKQFHKQLELQQKDHAKVQPLVQKLQDDPDDPAANLALGKYWCASRGNWSRGLPLLAKSNNAAFKELALQDLAAPNKAKAQVALGDGWWQLSKAEEGREQQNLEERAFYWYQRALPHLKGWDLLKAEKLSGKVLTRTPDLIPVLLNRLSGHRGAITSLAFAPDGALAVSASADHTLRLWDVAKSKAQDTLTGHKAQVWSVAFSADGQWLLSGSQDRTMRLWEVKKAKEVRCFEGSHTHGVWAVALSPDGQYALSGSMSGTIRQWDVQKGKEIGVFSGHTDAVRALAFTPDGRHFLSASYDGTARVWDIETGKELHLLKGHTTVVSSLALSPDGRHALTGSFDQTMRVWDIETGKELRRITLPAALRTWYEEGTGAAKSEPMTNRVWSVAWSPDGRSILAGAEDKTVSVWDAYTGQELYRLKGHGSAVRAIAISPDGQHLLAGGAGPSVWMWRLPR